MLAPRRSASDALRNSRRGVMASSADAWFARNGPALESLISDLVNEVIAAEPTDVRSCLRGALQKPEEPAKLLRRSTSLGIFKLVFPSLFQAEGGA